MTLTTENDSQSVWQPANFVRIVFRGIAQVLFQDNAITGLLFLIGIAVESPLMAVGALLGAVVGTVTAALSGFDREEINIGIYGFSPTLLGTATLFYLQPTVLIWILIVIGSVVTAYVTVLARRHLSFPTYTGPFVVVTWVLIIVAHAIAGHGIDVPSGPASDEPVGFLIAVLRGTAEIMFGANIITGLLFIVGMAISNWRHALIALLGSLLGTLLGIYHHNAVATISLGIYGYNASLAAIAAFLLRKSILIALLAAAISVPLTEFFPSSYLGIPALTAPFVVAVWIVIIVGLLDKVFIEKQEAT